MTNNQKKNTPLDKASSEKRVLFGRRIKQIRELADLTQEDLAHFCGITKDYLSKLERGKTNSVKLDTAFKLEMILGWDLLEDKDTSTYKKRTFNEYKLRALEWSEKLEMAHLHQERKNAVRGGHAPQRIYPDKEEKSLIEGFHDAPEHVQKTIKTLLHLKDQKNEKKTG